MSTTPAAVAVAAFPALALFRWLQSSSLSVAIRGSRWAFALIEMVHLLGIALLGGALLVIALRALRLALAAQPLASVVRGLQPLVLSGLAILLVSGAFLVADEPLRYYANAAFRTKLILLGVALVAAAPAYRRALRAAPHASQVAHVALLLAVPLLFLAIAVAGRLIGVL